MPSVMYGKRVLTREQFRTELTDSVRIAINLRLLDKDPNDIQARAILTDLKDSLFTVDSVERDHPTTIFGVQQLVTLGFINQAMADDLLYIASIQQEEIPQPSCAIPAIYDGGIDVWVMQSTEEQYAITQGPTCDIIAYWPDYICWLKYGNNIFVATPEELSFPSP
jgi:hypothetical protein